MNSFMQYTFAIIAIILTFFLILIFLPTLMDTWQDWIDEQRKRRERKNKCPQ